MSLNDIKLTPQMIADLYSEALIETNTSVMPDKPSIKYLGKNENILVVVNKTDVAFVPDEELNFLSTILNACKLNLADVAIINWNYVSPKNYQHVFEQLNSKQILLFDVAPTDFGLPINFPHFQIQQFDQRMYLSSPSLSEVEKNVELKKQLWTALKKMFSI